jgi:exonuclease III
MYIADNITYTERTDINENIIDALWIQVQYPNYSPILVATIYRPPSSDNQWLDTFESMMDTAYAENKEMILTGDFNLLTLALLTKARAS